MSRGTPGSWGKGYRARSACRPSMRPPLRFWFRRDRRAAGTLGILGVMLAVGCLIENKLRSAIRRPGANPVVAVVGGLGVTLAVAPAVIGVRAVAPPDARSDRLVSARRGRRRRRLLLDVRSPVRPTASRGQSASGAG